MRSVQLVRAYLCGVLNFQRHESPDNPRGDAKTCPSPQGAVLSLTPPAGSLVSRATVAPLCGPDGCQSVAERYRQCRVDSLDSRAATGLEARSDDGRGLGRTTDLFPAALFGTDGWGRAAALFGTDGWTATSLEAC